MSRNSTRSKARTTRMVYGLLCKIGKQSIQLERDSLCRRYAVNRHNVFIHGSRRKLAEVRGEFIQTLVSEGWERENQIDTVWLHRDGLLIAVDGIAAWSSMVVRDHDTFKVGVN